MTPPGSISLPADFPRDQASSPARVKVPVVLRDTREGPLWMQLVAGAWFMSTFAIFPGNAFFLYPLAAVFFVTLYFERERIMPVMSRCWFLFLIPGLCLLSYIWSAYPAATLRYGMFYVLSALSVIIIGSILTERQILRAFFFVALAGTALGLTEIGAIMATGESEYLGQKNFFAMKMMIGIIAGFAVAMNRKENPIIRILGLAIIPIAFVMVVGSKSATSMVLSGLAIFLLICSQLFWVNSRGVHGLRTFILGLAIVLGIAGTLAVLSMSTNSFVADAFGALGKDTTLTGRTALWEQAERTSAEHPILGVGIGGFWQYDVGAAQTLAENDNRDPGTILGFHNSYYEARVHLGFVGLFAFILCLAICLWKSLQAFIVRGTLERTCFFIAAMIMFSMTFTESLLFGFLHPGVYIFYLSAISAIAFRVREKRAFITLVPIEDPQPKNPKK